MRIRHTPAMALVGWYLILPPVLYPSRRVNPDAPITKWDHYQVFDTAKECEDANMFLRKKAEALRRDEKVNPKSVVETAAAQGLLGRCISSDDPRLK